MVVEELLRRLPAVDDATPAEALAFYEELASALATALDEQPLEHSSGA
jgi:hypothetical protein